jgi:DNA-directed RNA polymerase specialized sigma24 family protein
MLSALRGRTDADDALQQAYLRLMGDFERWPADLTDEQRLAFAHRTVHLAAKDALRQQFGRSDRAPKPREIPVDFAEDSREDDAATSPTQFLAQQLLSSSAARYPGDDEHLDTALKVAALGALDPVAHRIVTASQLGLNHRQVAKQLGLSHQTVRAKDCEARALLFSLIACARGRDIREATDINLFGYLEGERLSRAERRLAKQHLEHCASCQQIAGLRGEVDKVARRLVLPLPLVLAGPGALPHLLGTKHTALARRGVSHGAHTLTTSGGSATGSAVSAGAAKLVAAVGIAALLGAGATGVMAHRGGQAHRTPVAARRAATSRSPEPPARKVLSAASAPPERAERPRHRRRKHPRQRLVRPPAPVTASSAPTARLGAASSVRPAPPTPSTAPRQPVSSSGGGEFVLGGGH